MSTLEHELPGTPAVLPLDAAQRGSGPFVWRFNLFHRVTHALVMVSFLLLAATGLPLRFSQAAWAGPMMALFGGVEMAGRLHRIGAVITFLYFGMHVAYVTVALIRSKDRMKLLWGPESMVPQPRDVLDFVAQFRWYLGRGPQPQFGRYSYMEKFDYFAVFWGVAIIGGSGLLLWFPEFFARFLPGWAFNVAAVIHADEALLATGFIFTVHFFNVHLRPHKFPLDEVMFTGRATTEYMEEEHGLLTENFQALASEPPSSRPRLDAPATPPDRRVALVGAFLGFIALGIGILLIGMILWAVLFY
jgi:cytochrome b subunit of formate dehydrogenase